MDAFFFGLKRDPFARDPDVDEACLPPSRAKLLGVLLAESRERGSTSAVVGDPGAGKSAFAALLAAKIGQERRVALAAAFTPELDEIVGTIVADRVIIVDDAHLLEASALEGLCATRSEHVILIGRQPLAEKLASLPGRVPTHTVRLAPLSREEVAQVLAKRVAAAGGNADLLFSDAARRRLVDASHGLASVLESIAAECLRRARHAGTRQVGVEIMDQVLERAESGRAAPAPDPVRLPPPLPATPRPPPPDWYARPPAPWVAPAPPDPPDRRGWWIAGAAFAVVALLVLWKGLTGSAGSEEPPAPALRTSPIHVPIARADTVPEAPAPATVAPERASEPPATAPRSPATTPAAAPRERATTTTAHPRSPQWVVQVGVFRSAENANTALAKLRRIDPDADVERRKGLLFVVSRPFGSEAEAAVFERKLETAGMSTLVRERHRP